MELESRPDRESRLTAAQTGCLHSKQLLRLFKAVRRSITSCTQIWAAACIPMRGEQEQYGGESGGFVPVEIDR